MISGVRIRAAGLSAPSKDYNGYNSRLRIVGASTGLPNVPASCGVGDMSIGLNSDGLRCKVLYYTRQLCNTAWIRTARCVRCLQPRRIEHPLVRDMLNLDWAASAVGRPAWRSRCPALVAV